MGPQMTAGQTGGEQKGPPISSVYLLRRVHATQSCRSCAVSISVVVSLSPLSYVLFHVKARQGANGFVKIEPKYMKYGFEISDFSATIYNIISANFTINLGVNVRG